MISEENIRGLENTLKFIIKELEKRADAVLEIQSDETRKLWKDDFFAYRAMRKMAHEFSVDTREYDLKIEGIINKLRNKVIIDENDLNYKKF
jgi:hypothetical protein